MNGLRLADEMSPIAFNHPTLNRHARGDLLPFRQGLEARIAILSHAAEEVSSRWFEMAGGSMTEAAEGGKNGRRSVARSGFLLYKQLRVGFITRVQAAP